MYSCFYSVMDFTSDPNSTKRFKMRIYLPICCSETSYWFTEYAWWKSNSLIKLWKPSWNIKLQAPNNCSIMNSMIVIWCKIALEPYQTIYQVQNCYKEMWSLEQLLNQTKLIGGNLNFINYKLRVFYNFAHVILLLCEQPIKIQIWIL